MKGLLNSVRKVYLCEETQESMHVELLEILDSVELVSLPEYPSKVLVSLSSFEAIAGLSNKLRDSDTDLKEGIQQIFDHLGSVDRLQRQAKNLRTHLGRIQERLSRDGKFIIGVSERIGGIIGTFRQRCKQEFSEFLEYLTSSLKRILKPLVPNSVIKTNVVYPINLDDSASSEESEKTEEQQRSHVNMLVASLESVAKDLIVILGEAAKKFYEFQGPQLGLQSPLAAPLPEYFSFVEDSSCDHIKLDASSTTMNKILDEKLQRQMVGKDKIGFEALFRDGDLSITKREDIVFNLINSRKIENIRIAKNQRDEFKKKVFTSPTPKDRSRRSVTNKKEIRIKGKDKTNERDRKKLSRRNSEVRARSTTPEYRKSFSKSKSPSRRRKMLHKNAN